MIILCNSPLKRVTRCPLMFGRQTALIRVNLAHLNQDASYITVLPFVSSFFHISLRCDLITIAECIARIETAPAYRSGKTYIEKLRCERNSNPVLKGHRVQNRGVSFNERLEIDNARGSEIQRGSWHQQGDLRRHKCAFYLNDRHLL